MSDVAIKRHFKQPRDIVFSFLSQTDHILKWWGPEGGSVPDHTINFGKLGPWHAKMIGADGQKYHVSGEVTAVDEPNSIEFSWGWSDDLLLLLFLSSFLVAFIVVALDGIMSVVVVVVVV